MATGLPMTFQNDSESSLRSLSVLSITKRICGFLEAVGISGNASQGEKTKALKEIEKIAGL